jgi:hypothetical protein
MRQAKAARHVEDISDIIATLIFLKSLIFDKDIKKATLDWIPDKFNLLN